MKTIALLLAVAVNLCGQWFQRSYAIVIGINLYEANPRLQYARADATSVAAFLKGQGYQVIELYDRNASRGAILDAMDNVAQRATEHDRVVFFFAGHGATLSRGGRDWGYIVPSDGRPQQASTLIPVEELQTESEKMGMAKHQLFLMDSCYGGSIGARDIPGGVSRQAPNYLEEISKRIARQALTAGGKDQQVEDGANGHSRFTAALLEALQDGKADLNGDGIITFPELSAYMLSRAATSWQTPASATLPGHGMGEYWFASPAGMRTAIAPAPAPTGPRRGDLAGAFKVVGRIAVGGDGRWGSLTMDPASRRIYVAHGMGVDVVDVDAGKKVGEIANTPGVHGIALAPALNRGYTSNGQSNNVTIFDLRTLTKVAEAPVGGNPGPILFDSVSGKVFVFNRWSKDATALDAVTGKVAATIPIGGAAGVAEADGKGQIFLNIETTNEIAVIDSKALKVLKRYRLEGCEVPYGLALDRKRRKLFSLCSNKIMAISDPDTSAVIQKLPVGQGEAGYDDDLDVAFSSNGEGTLTVVKFASGKYDVAQIVTTRLGARSMAVDLKSHKVFLATAVFQEGAGGRRTVVPGTFELLVVAPQ